MKNLVTILVLLGALPLWAAIPEKKIELWATSLSWMSKDKTALSALEKDVKKISSLSRAYDPDCYWVKDRSKTCDKNPDPKLTEELDSLAAKFKEETGGAFDVVRKVDGKSYREYGGMVQGYVIDKLKQNPGAWGVNFAGDIFVSKPLPELKPIVIDDWEVSGLPLAHVHMTSGWVIGSNSTENGSKIVDPKTGNLKKDSHFQKIVLFAKPEFSGARLDAWSTALIVGGRELLVKLRDLKEFEGQWGYIAVDNQDTIGCSSNLTCTKITDKGRLVEVPW